MSFEPAYLRYQYSDPEKLRIRAETHRLYTEPIGGPHPFLAALDEHVAASAGTRLLDVGCGDGQLHSRFGFSSPTSEG